MTKVNTTRIDNFVCPACGEVIRQVVATDGVVKGWCPHAKKKIRVVVTPITEEASSPIIAAEPVSYLDDLKRQREKVLKEVVSAREEGDLKENSAYIAATEELSILDYKIIHEEERIKRQNTIK